MFLADMGRWDSIRMKSQSEILGTEHIMEFSYGIKVHRLQFLVKARQTHHPLVVIQVHSFEMHILWCTSKERSHMLTAQYRHLVHGIAPCKGTNHRDGHCNVAQRRKTDCQNVSHNFICVFLK